VQSCLEDVWPHVQQGVTPFVDAVMQSIEWLQQRLTSRLKNLNGTASKPASLDGATPMVFVGHLLSLLYGTFVFVYMPNAGVILESPVSILFHASMFLTLASYVQVMVTSPATVPDSPAWRTQDTQPPCGGARWCKVNGLQARESTLLPGDGTSGLKDGPSLSMGWQHNRLWKLQILHPFPLVCNVVLLVCEH